MAALSPSLTYPENPLDHSPTRKINDLSLYPDAEYDICPKRGWSGAHLHCSDDQIRRRNTG
jgi:hypothetical protein